MGSIVHRSVPTNFKMVSYLFTCSGIFCWRFFPLRKQLFPAARRFFSAAKRVFFRSDVFFLLRTCVFRALRKDKELENVESCTGRSPLVSWIAHMEIYTPVHIDCMCYVSGCNLHGGHNMMLSMVYLGRTLKLMQNGLRATRIGCNTVKMRFMCM